MKRVFSILLTLELLLNIVSVFGPITLIVKAAQEVSFTVEQVNGYLGENSTVAISVSPNSGISVATIKLAFDSTKLTIVSADKTTALDSGMADINIEPGHLTLAYVNDDGMSEGGIILSIVFKVKENITLQALPLNLDIPELLSVQQEELTSSIAQGAVVVIDPTLGDVNRDGKISSFDALTALRISTGKLASTAYTKFASDVNKSTTVTAIDALWILQFSTGRLKTFNASGGISAQKWVANDITFNSNKSYTDTSIITGGTISTFESNSVPTGWTAGYGGALSVTSTVAHSGSKSLCLANRTQTWYSPTFNLYNTIKNGGAGNYNISFWVYADALPSASETGRMLIRGNASDDNSFINNYNGSYYAVLANVATPVNTWTLYSANLKVLASDIVNASGTFNLVIDVLKTAAGQNLYFDDFQIYKANTFSAFNDLQLDVQFTNPENQVVTMPAFWDGGSTWKVRFAPNMLGTWSYKSICSDATDTGLHNQTGVINCTAYTGNLDIYKHGFVTTQPNTRYFMYDDGTPFFYLGDTHWSLPGEPYNTSVVAGIPSQFKYIIDKRVQQGFTVIQSEPLGAKYNLKDGVTAADIDGFKDMDNRFKYIADAGLVHANAQLIFAADLANGNYGSIYTDEYLNKLSRYWVARYAAYPVMWTTAQECDATCYGSFVEATNPWKNVFQWVNSYDPYKHPSTAHQENTSVTRASDSAFKDLPGYTWFGAQWANSKNGTPDFNTTKDYWNYSGSRPVVMYEGHYDHLWTNEYGARTQVYAAYLNGMYGHGYGVEDIWLYNSTYNTDVPSTVYGITITVEDKAVKWYDSVEFESAYQMGYARNFFNNLDWWNLEPRFDDTNYFVNSSSWYSVATKGNDIYVAYFYNNTLSTGTFKGLSNTKYTGQWYNTRTGTYGSQFTANITNGTYNIGYKPDTNDWVLLFIKS